MLWNQSIHKGCDLDLDYNVIGYDRPNAFISALNGTVNNGYERNTPCQLLVRMSHNRLLCSDLRDIRKISKQLPKGVMLITGDNCLRMSEKLLKRIKNYLGENPHPIWAGLQWISHVVCTVFIFYSTRTLLWGLYFAHSFYLVII